MSSINKLPGYAASYKDDYDYFVGNETHCSSVSHLYGSLIMIAVLVIGSMAAAQAFPPCATGWTTLGLGGGYMVVKLLGKDLHERRVDLLASALVSALLITSGSLGATAILTSSQLGYVLLGVAGFAACMTIGMQMGAKSFCPRPKQALKDSG